MSVQENIHEKVALTISEAWNANDLGRIAEIASEDFAAEASGGTKPLNVQQYIAHNQNLLAACPGSIMESRVIVSQDEYVVTHWKVTGVHSAPLRLSASTIIPATGKTVTVYGSSTSLIRGNKMVRLWSFWDMASLLQQIGVFQMK
jgi:predicted ester cyclase